MYDICLTVSAWCIIGLLGVSSREKSVCVRSPEKVIPFQGCLQKITYFVECCQEILAHPS